MGKPKWCVVWTDEFNCNRLWRYAHDDRQVQILIEVLQEDCRVRLDNICIYPVAAEMTADEWLK